MTTDYLVCPDCKRALKSAGQGLICTGCGTCFPIREGVPSFADPSIYWGEIDHEAMRKTNEAAAAKGWAEALNEVVRPLMPSGSLEYLVDDNRADWRFALPSMASWRVADLGAGWGTLTFALAGSCREIVALEGILERAKFIETRRRQTDARNMRVIHADAYRPPFAEASFDLIIVNGLLEWVALWNVRGSPRDVQMQFLVQMRHMLRPGGWLYVGIENRIGEDSFKGALDHSGLRYTMLLPRRVADWYVKRTRPRHRTDLREGYRTYTYSYWGYARLLRDAGLIPVDAYWVLPSYNLPRNMVPLNNKSAAAFYLRPPRYHQSLKGQLLRAAKRLLAHFGAAKAFASNFCLLARKA